MRSNKEARSRPHDYLIPDFKPTADDRQRLKTNVLPGEVPQRDTAEVMTKIHAKTIISSTPDLKASYTLTGLIVS